MRQLQWKRLGKRRPYIPAKNCFSECTSVLWQILFEIMKRNSQRLPKDSYNFFPEFCFPFICNTSQNTVSINELDLNAESNTGSTRKSRLTLSWEFQGRPLLHLAPLPSSKDSLPDLFKGGLITSQKAAWHLPGRGWEQSNKGKWVHQLHSSLLVCPKFHVAGKAAHLLSIYPASIVTHRATLEVLLDQIILDLALTSFESLTKLFTSSLFVLLE